jgi:putative acetyltransferase
VDFSIRPAKATDYSSTRNLVGEAFHPEDVVTFLDALRNDGCILGEWVAERTGAVIGHIVVSRVWIETADGSRVNAAILTPLAVAPKHQRKGGWTRLMQFAINALEARGETLFLVLSHPDYYARVGFSAATAVRVASPWSGNNAYMALGRNMPEGRLVLPSAIADAP